jgi:2-oxoacid:acceptor oxidoreductase gamma subunit (pyruvate/2-ketoisovalerate family)
MTLEIRLHGRGGQGGVTCAKTLAAIYARLGKSVQTFGDYAGERSGAPIRAYTRVSDEPITNCNKVYRPDHLLVLDPTLLSDDVVAGLAPGGLLIINTPDAPAMFAERFGAFRVATLDATAIARKHGIGTRSVVIVNTTIGRGPARSHGSRGVETARLERRGARRQQDGQRCLFPQDADPCGFVDEEVHRRPLGSVRNTRRSCIRVHGRRVLFPVSSPAPGRPRFPSGLRGSPHP